VLVVGVSLWWQHTPTVRQAHAGAAGSGAPVSSRPSPGTSGRATKAGRPAHHGKPKQSSSAQASQPLASQGSGGQGGASSAYVRPGTQGYRGSLSALTVYSAANGRVPQRRSCAWVKAGGYLNCSGANLVLDRVHIEGGLYWTGCGSLTITNSIIDWQPSQTWFDVDAACQTPGAGSRITASYSTFETGPNVPVYTGGSDVGPITEYTGEIPLLVSNSLIHGFPQGLDPGSNSVIKNNEIYTQSAMCKNGSACHGDGLFSQGGDNITYEGNYIAVPLQTPSVTTAAIFFQSAQKSSANKVIGNYLKGGSYTLYNEDSNGLDVEGNTFAGGVYGDAQLYPGASWGSWADNVHANGRPVKRSS